MNTSEASSLLDLPTHASPEQIEARFLELRTKLEDKIAKAPTPGLKAKYRESLEHITEAFETLTLAADGSALPVVQKSKVERPESKVGSQSPPPGPRSSTVDPRPSPAAPKKSGGSKEFAVVALIAVLVLAGGGWFVMKTREENAEKARIAAEAQAEADRLAEVARQEAEAENARLAEERRLAEIEKQRLADEAAAEAQRIADLGASLRAELAAIRVQWEAVEREASIAERDLSDLKSELRSLRDVSPPVRREAEARLAAQQAYTDWFSDFLIRHPIRTLRARAEELINARAIDQTAELLPELQRSMTALETEVREQSARLLAISAPVKIDSNPAGATWTLRDAWGRDFKGTTPGRLASVPFGQAQVRIQKSGWPEYSQNVRVQRGDPPTVSADFPVAAVKVDSDPPGAWVTMAGKLIGRTPLAPINRPPGPIEMMVFLPGYKSQTIRRVLDPGANSDSVLKLQKVPERTVAQVTLGVGFEQTDPAIVSLVSDASPGKAAGIQVGDRIKAIQHSPVSDFLELLQCLASFSANDVVLLTIEREGERLDLPVTLASAGRVRGSAYSLAEVDSPPEIIVFVQPIYPRQMISRGIEGRVMIEAIVAADGAVIETAIYSSTNPAFNAAATQAVEKFKYKPALKDGEPVATRVMLPIVFQLTD